MKTPVIVGIIVLFAIAAGVFVWYTWPLEEEEVVEEPVLETPIEDITQTYTSTKQGLTVTYPSLYTLDQNFEYQFNEDTTIPGIRFIIPQSIATGTNLALDSYVSVEQLVRANNCTGGIYVVPDVKTTTLTDGGVEYSLATTSEGAAGNVYEEWVYAIADSKPCTAVRYHVHSTQLGNDAEGTVRQFDKEALLREFDSIRHSITFSSAAMEEEATTTDTTDETE